MQEHKYHDKKSIRFINGKQTRWNDLVKDCVSFANSQGGSISIGIEDDSDIPPKGQKILDKTLPEKIHKEISNRAINVIISVNIALAVNDAEYIDIQVLRSIGIASTSDGKYYVRVSDECKPVPPDEMVRLVADKSAFIWEEQTNKQVLKTDFDIQKKNQFINNIRMSDRVSSFIKDMSDEELLSHYLLQKGNYLTNLGILWVGKRIDRATLLNSPTIQIIRYNEKDEKVWKLLLDDYYCNPKELLEKVIQDVPDWQESIEISEGMFRKNIPLFPIEVVRELVVNALVHRTYTTRGDIFINIYHDCLEIHSPGRLPYGVTPKNILSQSVRRNEHLSKIFYDLKLMEREGSGYDLVYACLLGNGKPVPIVKEDEDRVVVTVIKQFISNDVVKLMHKASNEYPLKQKEVISLGLIAQHQSLSAIEISLLLNQKEEAGLRNWLGKLLDYKLVISSGKTKGTQYFVNPDYLRVINFNTKTTLKNIKDHRLLELIYKDIESYPNSTFKEIHDRIGEEINIHKVRRILSKMLINDQIQIISSRRWARYSIKQKTLNNT